MPRHRSPVNLLRQERSLKVGVKAKRVLLEWLAEAGVQGAPGLRDVG